MRVIHHGYESYEDLNVSPVSNGFEKDYVLFVGNRGLYKNFIRFAKAFKIASSKTMGFRLICAGGGSFSSIEADFFAAIGISDRVSWKPIDETRLYSLYRNSICFVFPSLYEGFGIPILEAFRAKCPVVSSTGGSLPEICGDAALMFDPLSIEDMARQITRIVADGSLQQELSVKGFERAKRFTWRKCAEKTYALYKECI